ncbi:DUF4942 domain-containing protein [Burkholderia contaminans]|uniref:DUF4942 domain-containing protein n=2 Tax=Burkholderiaceae TaxID=119060 RepID=A0A1R1VUU5_9BURK|nr:DUF4942 domain-containing protein [Burkholderia contaminans]ELK7724790.1 DUF4942 domain-containing protein [Burkholderia cenocepacia]UTP27913.1 DUF4942 domain-containing protein [Burkholderia sp. FXe9]HBN6128717.1 DUF4942 domain-containing protein [Clostridioides difficile]MBA9833380.1 DUF4942 domain-containing protein [Burkholderia contaminans]MBH9693750.1 DUF4942 domain-containing protein [Burkholderia contaminans]
MVIVTIFGESTVPQATTDLVKSVSVENMLRQRDAVMERIAEAKRLIGEADEIASKAGFGAVSGYISDRYSHGGARFGHADFVEQMRKHVDASGWKHLMNESGIRTLMDAEARKQWDSSVYELKTPELTLANVTSTFTVLRDGREELFERGVIACFRGLSWDYKTNQPFKFGKRIVMRCLYQAQVGPYTQSVNHHAADKLDDLVRVFSVLDGKPEPDHRNGMYMHLSNATCKRPVERFIDLEYFEIRWFKNGNGHLTFKRPELVEKINRIIAKCYPHALASEVR